MFGEDICFIANVLSYIPALLTLQMLTVPSNLERKSKDGLTPDAASKRVFDVIFRDATVRAVLLLTFATAMFGFPYSVLLPVITKDVLHGNASILAFMSASAAIGGLIGSLTLARVKNRSTIGRLMGSSVIVLAIAVALLGYSTLLPLSMLCTLVAGAFMSLQFSGGNSLLQTSIDPAIRGRIMAVYSWALMGSAPLSALASGWLAEHFGVPIALGINAAFLVVAALAFLFCVPKAPQEPK
jgi:MFS family permease